MILISVPSAWHLQETRRCLQSIQSQARRTAFIYIEHYIYYAIKSTALLGFQPNWQIVTEPTRQQADHGRNKMRRGDRETDQTRLAENRGRHGEIQTQSSHDNDVISSIRNSAAKEHYSCHSTQKNSEKQSHRTATPGPQ